MFTRENEMFTDGYKKLPSMSFLASTFPQLVRVDDQLLVIEMSIVDRPFVLDFAGAYLDAPPEFSESIWEEWEAQKREQFEIVGHR
jgi:hypothetical protein